MCIIAVNYSGLLTKKTLENCYKANPDSMGLMYAQDGKLRVHKELFTFNAFYNKYTEVRNLTDSPIVLHFRITTSGKVDKENCHPFLVNQKLGFVHNGIITQTEVKKSPYSDTYHFNEILKKLPANFLYNKGIVTLIEKMIGYSKLAFLDNMGNVTIIGEDLGVWEGDNWFSNTGFEDARKVFVYNKYLNYYYCYNCGIELVTKEEKNYELCNCCARTFDVDLKKEYTEKWNDYEETFEDQQNKFNENYVWNQAKQQYEYRFEDRFSLEA
jgi:hypothetical protein